jgi:hypothetical protein
MMMNIIDRFNKNSASEVAKLKNAHLFKKTEDQRHKDTSPPSKVILEVLQEIKKDKFESVNTNKETGTLLLGIFKANIRGGLTVPAFFPFPFAKKGCR